MSTASWSSFCSAILHLFLSSSSCLARRVIVNANLDFPQEGEPNSSNVTLIDKFTPPQDWIFLRTARVTDSVEVDSLAKKDVLRGTVVKVAELYTIPSADRIRARIRSPIAGYVSVGRIHDEWAAAMPLSEYDKLHPYPSDGNNTQVSPDEDVLHNSTILSTSLPGHTCCCKDAGRFIDHSFGLSDEAWFFNDIVDETADIHDMHTLEFRYPADTPHPDYQTLRLCLVRNGWADPWKVDSISEEDMRSAIKEHLRSKLNFCKACAKKGDEEILNMTDEQILRLCPLGVEAYENRALRAEYNGSGREKDFEKYVSAVYEGKAGFRDRFVASTKDFGMGLCKGEDKVGQGGYSFFFPACGRMAHQGFINLMHSQMPSPNTINYFQTCSIRAYNCKWKDACDSKSLVADHLYSGRRIYSGTELLKKLAGKNGRFQKTSGNDLCTDGATITAKFTGGISKRFESKRTPYRNWWVAGASAQIRASPWCRNPETKLVESSSASPSIPT